MINRRRFLEGSAVLAAGLPAWAKSAVAGAVPEDDRILVVVELSGGNDGLNTVVPHGDDAYYRVRPELGIRKEQLLLLDDHFGLNPGMLGFQRLWEKGELAIVHGCGYDNPSFSHFTSMAYWHTAAPNSGEEYGWVGRLADRLQPQPVPNYLVNIDSRQSLAVRSRVHTPVVFDQPEQFQRRGFATEQALLDRAAMPETDNPTRTYLNDVARSGRQAAALIREAWGAYRTPVDYGIAPVDLNKVAACIAHGLPTRLYYVAYRNNAFDTHVQQGNLHTRLLSYACDAIHGFLADMERLGLADRVVLMAFSEFGRRVPENANLGTDHGAAGLMFLAGQPVHGGHYGELPSLTALDEGDNLIPTTDFRRVYATVMDRWLSPGVSGDVLGGRFDTLPILV
ncbi:MAG: DUF1501 domain-containing protein [Gammaproteobacteria bacterium]